MESLDDVITDGERPQTDAPAPAPAPFVIVDDGEKTQSDPPVVIVDVDVPVVALNQRKRKEGSDVWNHFTKVEGSVPLKALCNYCKKSFNCDPILNGTSSMLNHVVKVCMKNPNRNVKDPKQQKLAFKPKEGGGHDLVPYVFNLASCIEAIARMIIVDELPFKFVENEGILNFCKIACPQLIVPRRLAITKLCLSMYLEEKKKLKRFLKGQNVCVTTDTWTSIQNTNYMVLTVHYVDKDWVLNKKILSFCVVTNHRGETIGRMIEKCLLEWGIDSILTVTCDNASSNNLAIDWLKKKTKHWRNVVLEHEFLHIRCSAHIINLIVRDGLKSYDSSIVKIRNSVRYVRSSPSRWAMWNKCIKKEKIVCENNVCLDVATRWNSTFLMLESAEKFEKAFERIEDEDDGYMQYFASPLERVIEDDLDDEDEESTRISNKKAVSGPPEKLDWSRARMFAEFLQVYFETTKTISGSNYVTSNILFSELIAVRTNLKDLCDSADLCVYQMGMKMIKKFDKYWAPDKINPLLLVAVVLDPRFKLDYVAFSMTGLYDKSMVDKIRAKVKTTLERLQRWYASRSSGSTSDMMTQSNSNQALSKKPTLKWKMYNKIEGLGSMSEVDKYLTSTLEEEVDGVVFDILTWWKNNVIKYPILSCIARDIFAIPVTSVASESAFSTGGRIIDSFRSSLKPNTVEALICTQNWLRTKPIDLQACKEEVEQYEYDIIESELFESGLSTLSLTTECDSD